MRRKSLRSLRNLQKVAALNPAERRLLVRAAAALLVVRVALYVMPTRWLFRAVLGAGPRRASTITPEQPTAIGIAVARASRAVPRATCLPQALAARWLLAREGHECRLRVGVRRGQSGGLIAHAWVECAGQIVVGAQGVHQYTALPSIEVPRLWVRS
jgi:hypothetical protein